MGYLPVIQDHSDEFLNYFFDRNKTVKPFTLKRYMNFTQKNHRIWFNFNSKNIKLENRLRLACFLKPIFLSVDTSSYSFFYFLNLFSSSFDDVLRIPFCDFFNAILNDEDCSEKQKKIAFIYLYNGRRNQDIKMLLALVKENTNPLRILFLDSLELYYYEIYNLKTKPRNELYLELLCEILSNNYNSHEVFNKIIKHTSHTNERLNTIVLKHLFINASNVLNVDALHFLKYFNVEAAIPKLTEILNETLYLYVFYVLVMIAPEYHNIYNQKFKHNYNSTMGFFNNLSSGIENSYKEEQLLEALYIGDEFTLILLKEIRDKKHVVKILDYDVNFFIELLNYLE